MKGKQPKEIEVNTTIGGGIEGGKGESPWQ